MDREKEIRIGRILRSNDPVLGMLRLRKEKPYFLPSERASKMDDKELAEFALTHVGPSLNRMAKKGLNRKGIFDKSDIVQEAFVIGLEVSRGNRNGFAGRLDRRVAGSLAWKIEKEGRMNEKTIQLGEAVGLTVESLEEQVLDRPIWDFAGFQGALQKVLSPLEQEVIQLKFGFCGDDEITTKEISDRTGRSERVIRNVSSKAIRKLQNSRYKLLPFCDHVSEEGL